LLIGWCAADSSFSFFWSVGAGEGVDILVLRHELQVLRRQVGRPRLLSAERALWRRLTQVLPQARRRSFLVQAATLLRWHRELVRRR